MPEILTYNTPSKIAKERTKQSVFKSFFDYFNSKDKFTKLYIITFALIILATPFIVNQYLQTRQSAEQNQQQQNPAGPIEVDQYCIIKSPISIEDLTDNSSTIVEAKVESIDSEWRDDKNIWSKVSLKKTETLKGKDEEKFVINTYGGTVGNITEIAGCSPKFSRDEEVLLFLKEDKKNPQAFEVTGGFQGKFSVKDGQASRGIRTEKFTNKEIKDRVRNKNPKKESYRFNQFRKIVSELNSILVQDAQAAFTLISPPARRFPADIPVGYYMDINPNPYLGPSTYDVARIDLSMWSNAGANISLQDRGVIDNHNVAFDSKNMLIFNDFNNVMADNGIAVTFVWLQYDVSMTVNSTTFLQLLESDIVVNSKVIDTTQFFTNILGHEIGHSIGLNHDTIDNNAIMSVYGVIDEGAVLHQDDIDGVKFIYPPLPPPPPPTPPTASITGPTSLLVNQSGTFTGTASDPFGSLSLGEIYWSPTIPTSPMGDWSLICSNTLSGSTASFPCSQQFAAGTYYVAVNAHSNSGIKCTGNPFGITAGWADCGANDVITVTVTYPPKASPCYIIYPVASQLGISSGTRGYGDVDQSGQVTTADGDLILDFVSWGRQVGTGLHQLTPTQIEAADVSDSRDPNVLSSAADVDSTDAQKISQYLSGRIATFPVCIDHDGDGFTDAVETYIGTDPTKKCQAAPNPLGVKTPSTALPPDLDGDNKAGLSDALKFIPVMNTVKGDGKYNQRFDLNADGKIGTPDVLKMIPTFNATCSN